MTITKNYLEELKQVYYDVTDSDKTELRKFLSFFECDECKKADEEAQKKYEELTEKTSESYAISVDDVIASSISAYELNGFIKGYLFAKELMR